MTCRVLAGIILCGLLVVPGLRAQFNQIETDNLRLIYYGEAHAYLVRHAARTFENALAFHRELYDYTPQEKVTVLIHDLYDYGNAGAGTAPRNMVAMAIAPLRYVFETAPGSERVYATMNHELAHIVTNDQAAGSDRFFRSIFGGKVLETDENPLTVLYSYLATPRRSSPRWYREGIAVFLETWMTGGQGRALGGYDEMVFRAMVAEDRPFYDHIGIEAEGTQVDFQVGVNAYLYGTRFMTYLALRYGPERLVEWTGRRTGSEAYFAEQFHQVFGLSLERAWQDWIEFEHNWQRDNLVRVRQNPVTTFRPLTDRALGSVSRTHYDRRSNSLYAAVNYPGQVAHLARIDIGTGQIQPLHEVKGSALFDVCSLAYDPATETLFYTTDNNKWRDIRAFDVREGRERILLDEARIGDLAFNRADRSLWGIRHFNGISTIARIPQPYDRWSQVYSWPFGQDLYDLDISPDGSFLIGSLAKISGRQELIRMSIDSLLAGAASYETLFDFDRSIPANFTFSSDGRYLYGSSYYTGVSNVFRYDLERGGMEVMSNDEIGFFRPFPLSEDSLVVVRFSAKGFVPGIIDNRPAEKVSAIRFLGQELVEEHPVLRDWVVPPPGDVDIDALTRRSGAYSELSNVRLESVYPIVEGYKDFAAFGVRANFSSPIRLHQASVSAAYSLGSVSDERVHLEAEYQYRDLAVAVGYNATNFYDLFGPTRTSRKGYAVEVQYEKSLLSDEPKTLDLTGMVGAYGGFEELPAYQNVAATYDRLQAAQLKLQYTNFRSSLGAVDREKGFGWSLAGSANRVNDRFHPRAATTLDHGILVASHLSTWLRGSAGASIGERANPFANFYFGGFGNNWVDRGEEKQYRLYGSFPGLELNEVGGTRFAKVMNEWILPPLRFRRVGTSGLYLKWLRPSVFTSALVTNANLGHTTVAGAQRDRFNEPAYYHNVGAQLDLRVVVFSHLNTTLSGGYAMAFGDADGREWMFSIKLL